MKAPGERGYTAIVPCRAEAAARAGLDGEVRLLREAVRVAAERC